LTAAWLFNTDQAHQTMKTKETAFQSIHSKGLDEVNVHRFPQAINSQFFNLTNCQPSYWWNTTRTLASTHCD